jgi:outer membrane protein OmpA-like peptidoglycan-associated protein
MSAKAHAWLDLALDEYFERDNSGIVQDAIQRANQLVDWLEATQSEGVASPVEIHGSNRVREDLWDALDKAKQNPKGYPCAAPFLANVEVQLIWAGHEQPELGIRHAQSFLRDAEQRLKDAEKAGRDCPSDSSTQDAEISPVDPISHATPTQAAQAAYAISTINQMDDSAVKLTVASLPDAVHFAYDKVELSTATQDVLKKLSDILHAYPWLNLELVGYTDRFGSEKYNLKLSQRRAERVQQYLIGLGLSVDRFNTIGKGKRVVPKLIDGLGRRAHDRSVQFLLTRSTDPSSSSVRIEAQTQESDLQPGESHRHTSKKTKRTSRSHHHA